jgi:hypothetical protein
VYHIAHQVFLSAFENIISLGAIIITPSAMKALYPLPLPTHLQEDRLVKNAFPPLARSRLRI